MAVHTQLSKANINEIIQNYSLGELKNFNGIKDGIENTNYLIITETNKFIITIFEQRVDTSNIPFYFEVMINSNSFGINCPIPIKSTNGEYVTEIKKKKMAVFNFLLGSSRKKWSDNDCYTIGEKLARFHLANLRNQLSLKNQFSIQFWNQIFHKCKKQINNIIPNSIQIIESECKYLTKNWPNKLPSGVIHADLFPDNVFFQENKISGFLDFYFSCNDYFSYDLAICINAWCFPEKEFDRNLFKSLLSGYQSIRKLEVEEKECLNILLRGASLRFFFTRIHDAIFGTEGKYLKKKDPKEFFNILNFHMSVNSNNFYFE